MIAAAKNTHKSNFKICVGMTISSIKDITPTIDKILKILLPIMLEMTRLLFFFIEATMAVVSSGKHDPMATMPSPMTSFFILNFVAIAMDPSKNSADPIIKKAIPNKDNKSDKGRFKFLKKSSFVSTSSSEKCCLS